MKSKSREGATAGTHQSHLALLSQSKLPHSPILTSFRREENTFTVKSPFSDKIKKGESPFIKPEQRDDKPDVRTKNFICSLTICSKVKS